MNELALCLNQIDSLKKEFTSCEFASQPIHIQSGKIARLKFLSSKRRALFKKLIKGELR